MKYLSTIIVMISFVCALNAQGGGNYEAFVQSGKNRISQRNYYGAIDEFNKAIALNSERPEAYVGRAVARKRLQDYTEALNDIDRATEVDPSFIDAYIESGDIHSNMREFELALADYNRALELEPANNKALNSKILMLLQMNQDKEAQSIIDGAIKDDPKYGDFYYSRGILQNSKDRYSKAIDDFDLALEKGLNADPYGIYINRGFSFMGLEEYDNAIADFSKAIEIDPLNTSGYHGRARAYYHQDNFEQAIDDLIKCIEITQTNPVIYYDLGMAYLRLDESVNACINFQRSCQLGNTNACKKYLYECTTDLDDLK